MENQSRFLRPGEIWLITLEPIAPWSVTNCMTAASSVLDPRLLVVERQQLGTDPGDAMAGHELDQVTPVDADVAESPRLAAEGRVDPPVRVVGTGRTSPEVAAVDDPHIASRRGEDASPGFADRAVEAVREGDRVHHAGRGCGRLEALGVRDARGQGLLTDDVHAGGDSFVCQFQMGVVGGADVDDVDVAVGQCYFFPVRYMRTPPRTVSRRRPPGRRCATTAATMPPAARTARAWTSPMKPVPTITDRTADGSGGAHDVASGAAEKAASNESRAASNSWTAQVGQGLRRPASGPCRRLPTRWRWVLGSRWW